MGAPAGRHRDSPIDAHTAEALERAGVDVALTAETLKRINTGDYVSEPVAVESMPDIDDPQIVDLGRVVEWRADREAVARLISDCNLPGSIDRWGSRDGGEVILSRNNLRRLGTCLLPFLSHGVLNGGSATSYVDRKKNRGFDERLFSLYESLFSAVAPAITGRPKGVTPAFFDEHGRPGPGFLELKMRAMLLGLARYRHMTELPVVDRPPMFQMTSVQNDAAMQEACETYAKGPLLRGLIRKIGIDVTRMPTGVQPMIAAFTHSGGGAPREVFRPADERQEVLPLPGGHGQCFSVLRGVFSDLHDAGVRFIQIGNIDNLANTVDEVALAVLALSDSRAAFDFAFRTPVDVKGGVLVRTTEGRLTCADIGPAVAFSDIEAHEAQGKAVLFNCATGLFKLTDLVESIDRIISRLPLRLSDQDKDAGRYSQAEQITWEIMGILPRPLVFAVEKPSRFLAAKLLVENLLTSGFRLEEARRAEPEQTRRIVSLAYRLHYGLIRKLMGPYGLEIHDEGWQPVD